MRAPADWSSTTSSLLMAGRDTAWAMSQENVARYPVPPVRPRSRRGLRHRLYLRFPRLARLYWAALWRLPIGSRLRRELLARGDRDAFLAVVDPDAELNLFGQVGGLGLEDRYRGGEGVRRFWAAIDEAFEGHWFELQEVIDFGDRYLLLARLRARGRGSGVELVHAVGLFVTWSRGRAVRSDFYWSQAEALEAAGLRD
jgi:ketosteroid isomerase-like protein